MADRVEDFSAQGTNKPPNKGENADTQQSVLHSPASSVQMSQVGRPTPVTPSPEIFYDNEYDMNRDPRVIEQRIRANEDAQSVGSSLTIPQNDQFL